VDLLYRIERHLKRTGMRATTFGREAARDPRFVFDLRRGREPRPTLERRINAYLDSHSGQGDAPCTRR
jgi:2,4-dienoyl-CoA reductase-like NADH-dependent reductase (Old Yellow Enzyme family)